MTNKLRDICLADKKTFTKLPGFKKLPTAKGSYLLYKESKTSKILGVAHLDFVNVMPKPYFTQAGDLVFSYTLDDRLGVYVLLEMLKDLDINVLLTDDEEIGASTATFFNIQKEFNWIFQFDRRGTDVVTYQYETPNWLGAIKNHFPKLGLGAFSDICYLDNLGICGMNIGTGYHNEHTLGCYADLKETRCMVKAFRTFYHKYKDIKFEYSKPKFKNTKGRNDYLLDDNYYWTNYETCQLCGLELLYQDEIESKTCRYCNKVLNRRINEKA